MLKYYRRAVLNSDGTLSLMASERETLRGPAEAARILHGTRVEETADFFGRRQIFGWTDNVVHVIEAWDS